MVSLKRYLILARSPFLTASIIPVLLGTALAYRATRTFQPLDFFLVLFGMVFAHLGVNLANDYYDYRQGADQRNRFRNNFSGGSTFLVDGEETPGRYRNLMWLSFILAASCGLILMVRIDDGIGPILWFAIAGFISGYFYTAPPLKFVYRGFGELFILLGFGILPLIGTYYVHTGSITWEPLVAGTAVGLLTTNILYINQFPDFESDRDAGKSTLVVRLGTQRARFLYLVFLAGAALFIILGPVLFEYPLFYLLGLVALVPSIIAGLVLYRYHQDPPKLLKGQALTIITQLATGVVLTIGVLV
ncbi:MAG: 1,4-dihydroxy-2-naphthoate octaprenyltransferase [Deltaproteobacteria bacterium]|nr:1,4-dihydroxy-2-naphthoate octaprenyltransferase [Deltaproteobacteria bacterium]